MVKNIPKLSSFLQLHRPFHQNINGYEHHADIQLLTKHSALHKVGSNCYQILISVIPYLKALNYTIAFLLTWSFVSLPRPTTSSG